MPLAYDTVWIGWPATLGPPACPEIISLLWAQASKRETQRDLGAWTSTVQKNAAQEMVRARTLPLY